MVQMKDDENRMRFRGEVESVISEYYELCQKTGYPFKDDILDIIYDATNGEVNLSEL